MAGRFDGLRVDEAVRLIAEIAGIPVVQDCSLPDGCTQLHVSAPAQLCRIVGDISANVTAIATDYIPESGESIATTIKLENVIIERQLVGDRKAYVIRPMRKGER